MSTAALSVFDEKTAVEQQSRAVVFAGFARRTFGALSLEEARAALEVRPPAVGVVRRSGPEPFRILLFGGGALQGIGLRDHNVGLPGKLADRLAEQTGRGVHIDVVAEREPTSANALAGLAGLRLRRYDAVAAFLGTEASSVSMPGAAWRGALVGLARVLQTEAAPSAGVFFYDTSRAMGLLSASNPGRLLGGAAKRVEIGEELCSGTGRIAFRELLPPAIIRSSENRIPDSTLDAWGDLIAQRMLPTLDDADTAPSEESPRAYRSRPDDERLRQRALDCLRLRFDEADDALQREVDAVRQMFRVGTASVNIIDGEWQWAKVRATSATADRVTPRAVSFCTLAIQTDGLTLVSDAQFDARFRSNPLVTTTDGIRFYAAYPLHTWDGYRVGTLCIHDTTPRTVRMRDLEPLRDAAARIEQILWRAALQGRGV